MALSKQNERTAVSIKEAISSGNVAKVWELNGVPSSAVDALILIESNERRWRGFTDKRWDRAVAFLLRSGLVELVPHWEAVSGVDDPSSVRLTWGGREAFDAIPRDDSYMSYALGSYKYTFRYSHRRGWFCVERRLLDD